MTSLRDAAKAYMDHVESLEHVPEKKDGYPCSDQKRLESALALDESGNSSAHGRATGTSSASEPADVPKVERVELLDLLHTDSRATVELTFSPEGSYPKTGVSVRLKNGKTWSGSTEFDGVGRLYMELPPLPVKSRAEELAERLEAGLAYLEPNVGFDKYKFKALVETLREAAKLLREIKP